MPRHGYPQFTCDFSHILLPPQIPNSLAAVQTKNGPSRTDFSRALSLIEESHSLSAAC
jgi:hypothetical protein